MTILALVAGEITWKTWSPRCRTSLAWFQARPHSSLSSPGTTERRPPFLMRHGIAETDHGSGHGRWVQTESNPSIYSRGSTGLNASVFLEPSAQHPLGVRLDR